MKVVTATEAKTHFGKYMAAAQREPITVSKTGHEAIVMLSKEDYDNLLQVYEDMYWGEKALRIKERNNFIGVEESQKIIERFIEWDKNNPDEED